MFAEESVKPMKLNLHQTLTAAQTQLLKSPKTSVSASKNINGQTLMNPYKSI